MHLSRTESSERLTETFTQLQARNKPPSLDLPLLQGALDAYFPQLESYTDWEYHFTWENILYWGLVGWLVGYKKGVHHVQAVLRSKQQVERLQDQARDSTFRACGHLPVHSHDKKREFEEKNIKTSYSLSNGAEDEVIKLGRKDVQARLEKTTLVTDGKVEEAEGGGGVQEDNTNEEDEQEEDIKHEVKEDEGRGGGDDEIDENNQHKFDMELEREENLIDEKDAEGKDTEDEKDAEGKDTEDEEGERSDRENSKEVERSDNESSEEGEKSDGENSEEVERSDRENSEEMERSRRENSEEVERSRRENSEELERSNRENSEEGQRERENSEEGQRERENSEEGQRERENSEEGQRERENSGEGQREREEEDHEAREEHYIADDASSAVAHETESESLEKLNEASPTEEESSNNVEESSNKAGRQNSAQGNQTVGNDIPQNDVTANGRGSLNSTMTKGEKGSSGLEEGNDPIEMGIENSTGGVLNKIPEDEEGGPPSGGEAKNLQQKSAFYTSPISSDLNAINNFTTHLEEEKTLEISQNIVHESASKGNTTTGAELDHSEAVEGDAAAAGETNKSGSELESGKEDPNSDSSLSDPIDSLDSSSSHLESSSSVHDHVGEDNIIRTMEAISTDEDAATTTTTK